jgi:hypothetical protein
MLITQNGQPLDIILIMDVDRDIIKKVEKKMNAQM